MNHCSEWGEHAKQPVLCVYCIVSLFARFTRKFRVLGVTIEMSIGIDQWEKRLHNLQTSPARKNAHSSIRPLAPATRFFLFVLIRHALLIPLFVRWRCVLFFLSIVTQLSWFSVIIVVAPFLPKLKRSYSWFRSIRIATRYILLLIAQSSTQFLWTSMCIVRVALRMHGIT